MGKLHEPYEPWGEVQRSFSVGESYSEGDFVGGRWKPNGTNLHPTPEKAYRLTGLQADYLIFVTSAKQGQSGAANGKLRVTSILDQRTFAPVNGLDMIINVPCRFIANREER